MWLTLYFYCILILPWEAGLLLLKTRQSQANQNELVVLPQVSTPDLILRALGQAGLRNHPPNLEMSEDVQGRHKIPAAAGLWVIASSKPSEKHTH